MFKHSIVKFQLRVIEREIKLLHNNVGERKYEAINNEFAVIFIRIYFETGHVRILIKS